MTSFSNAMSLLLLSLGPLASWGGLPSFLVTMEEEWHYYKCDPAMCWWTTFDIEIDTDYRSVLWEKFWEIAKFCFQRPELKSRDSRLRLGLVGGVSNHWSVFFMMLIIHALPSWSKKVVSLLYNLFSKLDGDWSWLNTNTWLDSDNFIIVLALLKPF